MTIIYLEAWLLGESPVHMYIAEEEIIGVYFKPSDEYFTLLMKSCRNERILKRYLEPVMQVLRG